MATEYTTVEVRVRVNDAGDYEVGTTLADSGERFEEHIGSDAETGYRVVKVSVKVPLPKPAELAGEVGCKEAGELKAV